MVGASSDIHRVEDAASHRHRKAGFKSSGDIRCHDGDRPALGNPAPCQCGGQTMASLPCLGPGKPAVSVDHRSFRKDSSGSGKKRNRRQRGVVCCVPAQIFSNRFPLIPLFLPIIGRYILQT